MFSWKMPVRYIFLLVALIFSHAAWSSIKLENVRMWHGPTNSRLVFDLSAPVKYSVYKLSAPRRMVIDLDDAVFKGVLPADTTVGQYLHRIRKGTPRPGVLRIVLDLRSKIDSSVIVLEPNDIYGHRLVIDLTAPELRVETPIPPKPVVKPVLPKPQARRGPVVIAIDAGHGGEDPGASGAKHTQEKHVVLAIARQLEMQLNRHSGLEGRLTRRGDYYISLRERTRLARKFNADLFVSIHADGFYNKAARGTSVYALSNKGATSETARWLANKENASDLVGGISLHDKDDLLAQVLLDLSMTRAVSDGIIFARYVLPELKRLGPVHSRRVEQAGFAVLKSPDIPSILIETGYITNPREEKLLRSKTYQKKLAAAIYNGIVQYLNKMEMLPDSPRDGVRMHLVSRGDSLSIVAMRYGVSVNSLKRANDLHGNQINIGQKLKIPARGS